MSLRAAVADFYSAKLSELATTDAAIALSRYYMSPGRNYCVITNTCIDLVMNWELLTRHYHEQCFLPSTVS